MPKHHALRRSGRARGEDDVAHVVGLTGVHDRAGPLEGDGVAEGQELLPAAPGRLAGEREVHGVLEGAQARRGGAERADVVGAEELPRREEEAGVGRAEDERRLLALQAGVERDEPGPGGEHAQRRRDPRRRVRCPHGHAVARLDAGRDQAARHRHHPVLDVDEREPGLAVDDRLAIAEALRAGPDHLRDRPVPVLGCSRRAPCENA